MKALKKLSQVLGAISKGWAVDTKLGGFPITQVIKNVAAASNTSVKSAVTLGATPTTVTANITNPDCYRCVKVKGNQASVYGNVTILGNDRAGNSVEEVILASGTGAVEGVIPFSAINTIIFPAKAATGDTISVGVTDKLGLYRPINADSDVLEISRKASAATAYTIEALGAIDEVEGTITISGGVTADDSFKIQYVTDYF